jgi:hypothetical protein
MLKWKTPKINDVGIDTHPNLMGIYMILAGEKTYNREIEQLGKDYDSGALKQQPSEGFYPEIVTKYIAKKITKHIKKEHEKN